MGPHDVLFWPASFRWDYHILDTFLAVFLNGSTSLPGGYLKSSCPIAPKGQAPPLHEQPCAWAMGAAAWRTQKAARLPRL